jgi:hypothetical protein
MQPCAAARAHRKQANDARQHHAATKVRSRSRRNQHATLEAKRKTREHRTRRRMDEPPATIRRDFKQMRVHFSGDCRFIP